MPASWVAWAQAHKPVIGGAMILVLAVAAGATAAAIGAGDGGGRGTAAARTPAAAGTARAGPPRPAVTGGTTWLTGSAGRLLDAVTADVGRINVDQRAGNPGAAHRDGTRLAADAATALRGSMPPVDASRYRAALREFEQAGVDTAAGKFSAASALLVPANLGIVTVTAAVNPPSLNNNAS